MEVEKDKSREETSNESKKMNQKTTLHHQIKYGTKKEDLKKKTSAKKQVSHSIQCGHPLSNRQSQQEMGGP